MTHIAEHRLTRGDLIRRMPWADPSAGDRSPLMDREWLVTNGLGGYASGTVACAPTRRYHGLLIAALPSPFGRWLMLADLAEEIGVGSGRVVRLGGHERDGALELHGAEHLREFRLEDGLPHWIYDVDGVRFEKSLFMPHMQNTVVVRYRIVGDPRGAPLLRLRPLLQFRPHDAPVSPDAPRGYRTGRHACGWEIAGETEGLPPLRFRAAERAAWADDERVLLELLYRVEERRGYAAVGALWGPGYFETELTEEPFSICASLEPWDAIVDPAHAEQSLQTELTRRQRLVGLAPVAASGGPAAELVLAADQFIISPAARLEDEALAHAEGGEARSVIAGYHWFTDWGRDTMIGLEGLALATGRHREAAAILRTFARHVRDGLIPNLFPEGGREGLYHTADASLWYFHAVHRYVEYTGDEQLLDDLLPTLLDMIDHHVRGTRFGIGVDPTDGLLRQGAEGYQLTWMDAKVGDWVVTPRRGKAVEINALWYNALRLVQGWIARRGKPHEAEVVARRAEQASASFNTRFWYERGGYLYDVVDGEEGDDPALRPNQLFAISLPHPVLEERRWGAVLEVCHERLLTRVGLRSLSPDHPDYQRTYHGDLRARDAAYHQGTVWAWLIGPYVDAWRRVNPGRDEEARELLGGLIDHLDDFCIGSMAEVFDAEEPHRPRGCIAQAWSVAEVLRCLVSTSWESAEFHQRQAGYQSGAQIRPTST